MGNKTGSANATKQTQSKDTNQEDDNDGVLLSDKFDYLYAKRRCSYRSEQLEMSPQEIALIRSLIPNHKNNGNNNNNNNNEAVKQLYDPYKQILALSANKPVKIIIDTDIGTDIDDVFTMLLLSHLPPTDVEVLGITTNYRPTVLRKHIAESILQQTKDNGIHDLSSVPVVAGNCYLCGTHRPFFYAGNEGEGLGLDEQDSELMAKYWQARKSEDAEDFIYQQLCKYPQQVTIVSIGIPTNIGNLVHKYGKAKIESLIGHIVMMGGGSIINADSADNYGAIGVYAGGDASKWRTKWDWQQQEDVKVEFDLPQTTEQALQWIENYEEGKVVHLFPNHNLSGDTLASVLVFSLRCPISLIPHHVTQKHWLEGKPIETLLLLATKSDDEKHVYEDNENGICALLMREWFRVRRGQRGQCLHDPLTLYEAIYCKQIVEDNNEEAVNDNNDEEAAEVDEKEDNDENAKDEVQEEYKLEDESGLKYCNGYIVCHEWAAFVTFVPDRNGPHRFAYRVKNNEKWLKWCGEKMICNVSEKNVTEDAGDYNTVMNTFAKR